MVAEAAVAEGYISWFDGVRRDMLVAERFGELLKDHFFLAGVVEVVPTDPTNPGLDDGDLLARELNAVQDECGDGHIAVVQAPSQVARSHGLPYRPNVVAILHHAAVERSDHPHRRRRVSQLQDE
jgi:hypothetical protein